jgi:DNA-directed RNA polymerase subunit RPC12/RpoP
MKIRLVIPPVKPTPADRPASCPHCGHWRLHRHGHVTKPLKDHRQAAVLAERYRCCGCGRTFRHYPAGVSRATQRQRTIVLAALCYGLGLSCSASAHLLGALGIELCAMTVWRDAQAAGAALRRTRPGGTVQVLGADETVYRVRGQETVVGFVTDGQTGLTLDFMVLAASDGAAFRAWLAPYVEQYGVEVLVTDEHASYGVVAADLGVEQQLCLAHVRKALTNRRKAILAQARQERTEEQQLHQLATELARIRALVRELPADGGQELERLHRRYLAAVPPGKGGPRGCPDQCRLPDAPVDPGVVAALGQAAALSAAAGARLGWHQQRHRTGDRQEQAALPHDARLQEPGRAGQRDRADPVALHWGCAA